MSDSVLEQAFITWWERLAPKDLPEPERELQLIPGRNHQTDFAWVAARVLVEVDGGQHAKGGGRHNSDKDRWKINKLSQLGWQIFRYSGSMIENDPVGMIEQVADAVRLGLPEKQVQP